MKNVREYFRPTSIEEATRLKRTFGDRAAYLGGGSDLLVLRPDRLEAVIDIRKIGIDTIEHTESGTWIGGAARLCDVEREAGHVARGMLGVAVRETAPWLVRNTATLAGNIANASPAADSVPALLALDATVVLIDGKEEEIPLPEILLGPHETTLGDRLVRAICISSASSRRSAAFIKLARSKSDIAQVNVSVSLRRDGDVARDVRIALGAVGPTALRTYMAEALLEGQTPTPDILGDVEKAVRDEVRPISDWRASADYRRRVAGILARRCVSQAWSQQQSEEINGN